MANVDGVIDTARLPTSEVDRWEKGISSVCLTVEGVSAGRRPTADGLTRKSTSERVSTEMAWAALYFLPRKAFLRGMASVRLAEVTIEWEMERTGSEKVDGPERWAECLPFFLSFPLSGKVVTTEASSPGPAQNGKVSCR